MTQPQSVPNGGAKKHASVSPVAKASSVSATTLCEILNGTGTASLSEVLDIMDLAAGRTAFRHIGGMTVTVSFEDLVVRSRIPRGAIVRASAEVVAVGKSSVLLRVHAEVEDLATRTFVPCIAAYATFVATARTPEARAAICVPAVIPADDAAGACATREKTRLAATRRMMFAIAGSSGADIAPDGRHCGAGAGKEVLPVGESVVNFQKQYLPRHKNFAGMVFGGDLLETMERVACYCGKRFVRGAGEVGCVAIKYFNFIQPIEPMNLWCLRGRVAAVVGSLMYVEVVAFIDKNHSGVDMVKSNEGLFAVLLTNEDGVAVDCPVSLGLDGADEDCLRAHKKAALWISHDEIDVAALKIQ